MTNPSVADASPTTEANRHDRADATRVGQGIPSRLASRGFVALLVTQFLTACNDNMFRWLIIPIGKPVLGSTESLALGLVCFTLPYLLLASLAGFLADRFEKTRVVVACKIAEMVVMLIGLLALAVGEPVFVFVTVALMGAQSALFSPSKMGLIPELLPVSSLSTGNGLMGMMTVVSSALGTVAGTLLFAYNPIVLGQASLSDLWGPGCALLGVAVLGLIASLFIERQTAADPQRPFVWNPIPETIRGLKILASQKPLFRTAWGIGFFWLLASLSQVNIDSFAMQELQLPQREVGVLLAVLVLGLGAGSLLAGWCSGGRVELGLVPIGAAGIIAASIALAIVGGQANLYTPTLTSVIFSGMGLFLLGISAGLFNIPLEAFLQHRSELRVRGTILATSNFITFSMMMLAGGLFYAMQRGLGLSASQIFLTAGLATVPVLWYAVAIIPQATVRMIVWFASRTIYRVRIYGRENIPETGGALLVPNHVSWIDGIMILLSSSRHIRMLAYADYVNNWKVRWVARLFGVIPIRADGGPKALLRSLKAAREAVENGELVCIFAEGRLTRTGQVQTFQRGMMRIIDGLPVPVVPVYLDELWGSVFSFRGGKFFRKWPTHWPYPVTLHFGKPRYDIKDSAEARQAVQLLGAETVTMRIPREITPPRLFVRAFRRALFRKKVADSSGLELTGGQFLTACLVMRRLLSRRVLAADEKMVGLLLPPSVGGAIFNAALALMRRVAVNLNYTLTNEQVASCVQQCGIRHVLTTRKVLEKKPFQLPVEYVYVEDLKDQATLLDKVIAAAITYLLPARVIEHLFGLHRADPQELLTVVFTSGSTGEPKGVMLSHSNITSNTDSVDQLFNITKEDSLIAVLPFFHSFGYTGTLWLALVLDLKVAYHFNPLDARTVGKLTQRHHGTILMATPTFLRSYSKRCSAEEFASLNLVVVGAEKMPLDLYREFLDKFGVAPTEGYGCTELSPVGAFNVPANRTQDGSTSELKLGTIGRCIPGTVARITHPETGAPCGTDEEGLLWFKGPNVMQGYLNHPEKTAEVVHDGWYNTGDIGRIDADGFITITGRQSRFSKIGGEMVPHVLVEQLLTQIISDPSQDEDTAGMQLAVTSATDPKKGERLIVLHRPLTKSKEQVLAELAKNDIPNLWIPSADSFYEVDEIPVLGSGKLDLRHVQELASKLAGEPATTPEQSIPPSGGQA